MPSPEHPNTLPLWDEATAMQSSGGDPELARSLLHGLLEELPTDLAELHRIAARGDLHALADKAHKTRGGAVYCGVTALNAALLELDLRAAHGDAPGAEAWLSRVAEEIARLRAVYTERNA